jgi:hypothetical protein
MYQLKYTAPADGFCVSTALANLYNNPSLIERQKELGLDSMSLSEAAAHFRFYTETIAAGVPITSAYFGAIVEFARKSAGDETYICLAVQTLDLFGAPHFVLLLVGRAYIFTIDAADGGMYVYAHAFVDKLFAQKMQTARAIHIEYDLAKRAARQYSKDDLQHLFS